MRETRKDLMRLLGNAYRDIQAAARVAETDESRPKYHFRAPGQWMDDPNGIIYHKGYYHMMYSQNPNSSTARAGMVYKTAVRVWDPESEDWTGGITVWGHARSRDLVHWEHLPIALFPSIDKGEHFVWFGCTRINADGVPMAFYTSVGPEKRPEDTADQWAAVGDDDLVHWKPVDCNPILDYSAHGDVRIGEWRDPFVFSEGGKTYMILGGTLPKDQEGYPVIALYEAQNPSLTSWAYKGILFRYGDKTVPSIECPNIAKLGGKWVIVVSPHKEVEYYVGSIDFDKCVFTEERRAVMDFSTDYYATNILYDDAGRCLMWGSVVGVFENTKGWNCCLSLPKEISLRPDHVLIQKPVRELEALRGEKTEFAGVVDDRSLEIIRNDSGTLEILATVQADCRAGIRLEYGGNTLEFACDGDYYQIGDCRVPRIGSDGPDRLHIFIDRSLMDVFLNETDCVTRIIKTCTGACSVKVFAESGTASVEAAVWNLEADGLFVESNAFRNGTVEI